ncbi:MAG: hypothetical protein FWF43_01620 [Propionibacteriaceae bacterium]|nr:hypothetical protein [Propionibacteriaceae bacterium]
MRERTGGLGLEETALVVVNIRSMRIGVLRIVVIMALTDFGVMTVPIVFPMIDMVGPGVNSVTWIAPLATRVHNGSVLPLGRVTGLEGAVTAIIVPVG